MIIRILESYVMSDKEPGYESLLNLHDYYELMCDKMFDKLDQDYQRLAIDKLREMTYLFSDIVESNNICLTAKTDDDKLMVLELDEKYSDYALSVDYIFEEHDKFYANVKLLGK